MSKGVSCGSLCLRRAFCSTHMDLYASHNSEIGLKIGGVKLAARYNKSIQYPDPDDHDEKSPVRFLRQEADQSVVSGTEMA